MTGSHQWEDPFWHVGTEMGRRVLFFLPFNGPDGGGDGC